MLFEMYDMNSSGYLENFELKEAIIAMLQLLNTEQNEKKIEMILIDCIKQLDVNHDGRISKSN